jgi:hypothetical protein
VTFYRYLVEHDVHVFDCAGRVDLATGLERLKVLERELAARPLRGAHRKLLIDFRGTEWDSEDTHRELSTITRRDFGLNAENTALRAALLNQRWSGAISHNEHWFFTQEEALTWLCQE